MAVKRIVVCDDNADAADVLALLLESHGYEVKVFYDGASCLRHAVEWKPDIALLDIGMPDITGYSLARSLREAFGREILLVAITAYSSGEHNARAYEAGFDMHVSKPADIERIREIVVARH